MRITAASSGGRHGTFQIDGSVVAGDLDRFPELRYLMEIFLDNIEKELGS